MFKEEFFEMKYNQDLSDGFIGRNCEIEFFDGSVIKTCILKESYGGFVIDQAINGDTPIPMWVNYALVKKVIITYQLKNP